MQKKNIRQSIFGIILTAYSLLYPIFASFYREEITEGVKVLRFAPALGLLVASGLIGATVLFARKMLDDSSKKLITLAALVETVILAVAGIIAAFSRKNIIYNILEVIAAAVVMILFIWICKGKVKFIDTCSDKVFWITLVAMYLIFPSVAILLKELILLLLGHLAFFPQFRLANDFFISFLNRLCFGAGKQHSQQKYDHDQTRFFHACYPLHQRLVSLSNVQVSFACSP